MASTADKITPESQSMHEQAPLRFVTAASLFDGHDAAINMIRRLLQFQGAEVIHLGHNRSVADIVRAAIQEDADGIACSSYQGGHNEYFKYMVDMLREANAEHIRVVVGGGGTISPEEIADLEAYGVEKIYTPSDGMEMGLTGMIEDVFARTRAWQKPNYQPGELNPTNSQLVAQSISLLEENVDTPEAIKALKHTWSSTKNNPPILGITGTGGAGKSSLTDELLNRFLRQFPEMQIAVIAVDPTRRRSGGALLGDRIRMNSLSNERVFMRSLATRRQHLATSAIVKDSLQLLKFAGFDLIILETAGIGQSDTEVVDLVDHSMYVMTSEYGAASQLEKIDMLDFADLIALNKFEKRGAEDALRDVRKQWKRNRVAFQLSDEEIPVYPTIASQFNDPGVNHLFAALCQRLGNSFAEVDSEAIDVAEIRKQAIIPAKRNRYLAEIAENGRKQHSHIDEACLAAKNAHAAYQALALLKDPKLPQALYEFNPQEINDGSEFANLRNAYHSSLSKIGNDNLALLRGWDKQKANAVNDQFLYQVRGKDIQGDNYTTSLSLNSIPKIAVPEYESWGELLKFLAQENLPGSYPYTAGVYPYRREGEDPARMFAGEGTPERTNRRFHYVSLGQPATRLSTAFDSVTLYGEDPDPRPDIYGRIGNSGVSIASLDDMKKLYSGFDLCAKTTSVSMTINGPAPMILAMFMNTAIDQQVEKYLKDNKLWEAAEKKIAELYIDKQRPSYQGDLPEGNDGFGLGTLGVSGDQLVDAETYAKLKAFALNSVRGTVQADIFKEDQAQNTCIFSTEFALRMMGDVQQYFIDQNVRNFYSVSISGYHIAEAGANPISQLAFTLANGFTLVEYYLSRGMQIDEFAPNLSFFFSNGMDPEYAVIGRVARRIWARAMKVIYQAGPRSQMLKYHIQTSGRSLHAQEIQFNDIRTTLQAMYALFDNCNSLHTNAYDEALTTPTEESVRRALAIQLIINKELGLNKIQNPWQGSFAINYLTDMVEEAVYQEFERISERGGVLGAMETMYQRGKIQEESLHYETLKHNAELPLIGVNTFLNEEYDAQAEAAGAELIRSTEAEKQAQVSSVRAQQSHFENENRAKLAQLQETAANRDNVFAGLMEVTKTCTLGQISHALYDVGGQYRRNM